LASSLANEFSERIGMSACEFGTGAGWFGHQELGEAQRHGLSTCHKNHQSTNLRI